ncbi:hypothetical protein ACFL24_00735 [Patescibacteria group bacterium]
MSDKSSATFSSETNSIGIFVKGNLIDKYLAGIGHEMGHLHPFYGGFENKNTKTKWEIEETCEFIEDKIRLNFGDEEIEKLFFQEAKDSLDTLQKMGDHFSWEEAGVWTSDSPYEIIRFIYPWLEKQYGIEKLRELWNKLFKEKNDLSDSIKETYGKDLEILENKFMEDFKIAKSYKDLWK